MFMVINFIKFEEMLKIILKISFSKNILLQYWKGQIFVSTAFSLQVNPLNCGVGFTQSRNLV